MMYRMINSADSVICLRNVTDWTDNAAGGIGEAAAAAAPVEAGGTRASDSVL